MLDQFTRTDIEQCGVIIADDQDHFTVVEVPNSALDPTEDFAITYAAQRTAMDSVPGRVVGWLHTHLPRHPVGPSVADIDAMDRHPTMIAAVLHVGTRRLTWFDCEGVFFEEKV